MMITGLFLSNPASTLFLAEIMKTKGLNEMKIRDQKRKKGKMKINSDECYTKATITK